MAINCDVFRDGSYKGIGWAQAPPASDLIKYR